MCQFRPVTFVLYSRHTHTHTCILLTYYIQIRHGDIFIELNYERENQIKRTIDVLGKPFEAAWKPLAAEAPSRPARAKPLYAFIM